MTADTTKLTVDEQKLLAYVESARIEQASLNKVIEGLLEDIQLLESSKGILEFEIKTIKERKDNENNSKNSQLDEKEARITTKTKELRVTQEDLDTDIVEFHKQNIALNIAKERLIKEESVLNILRTELKEEADRLVAEDKQLCLKLKGVKNVEAGFVSREASLLGQLTTIDDANNINIIKNKELEQQSLKLSNFERSLQSKDASINANIAGVELWKKQLDVIKTELDELRVNLSKREADIEANERIVAEKLDSFQSRETSLTSRELKVEIAEKEVRIRELQVTNANLDKKLN